MIAARATQGCCSCNVAVISTVLVTLLASTGVQADILTVGAPLPLQASATQSLSSRSVFLLDGSVSATGVLYSFQAVFVKQSAVTIQIWRPVVNFADTYTLVAQYPYVFRGEVNSLQSVNVTCFPVVAGDKIGAYFDKPSPVAYVFTSDLTNYVDLSSATNYTTFTLNQVQKFDELLLPYRLQITAYIDTNAVCNAGGDKVSITTVGMTTLGTTTVGTKTVGTKTVGTTTVGTTTVGTTTVGTTNVGTTIVGTTTVGTTTVGKTTVGTTTVGTTTVDTTIVGTTTVGMTTVDMTTLPVTTVASTTVIPGARCDIAAVGAPWPLQTSATQSVKGRAALLIDGALPAGILYGFKAVFTESTSPVSFQVWRPVANQSNTYQLVAQSPPYYSSAPSTQLVYFEQMTVNDTNPALNNTNSANSTVDFDEIPPLDTSCFPVMAGDRIGLYLEKPGSIAYIYTSNLNLFGYHVDLSSAASDLNYEDVFTVDQTRTFVKLVFPYQFQITAYVGLSNDIDTCSSYVIPEDDAQFALACQTTVAMTTSPATTSTVQTTSTSTTIAPTTEATTTSRPTTPLVTTAAITTDAATTTTTSPPTTTPPTTTLQQQTTSTTVSSTSESSSSSSVATETTTLATVRSSRPTLRSVLSSTTTEPPVTTSSVALSTGTETIMVALLYICYFYNLHAASVRSAQAQPALNGNNSTTPGHQPIHVNATFTNNP